MVVGEGCPVGGTGFHRLGAKWAPSGSCFSIHFLAFSGSGSCLWFHSAAQTGDEVLESTHRGEPKETARGTAGSSSLPRREGCDVDEEVLLLLPCVTRS